jgi:hypothetical protein
MLGDDIIVVDAAAASADNFSAFLPPGGWMEMNQERARMTFSGGIHSEIPPDTVDFPNASQFFPYNLHKQYTNTAPATTFTQMAGPCCERCGKLVAKQCSHQMYVREGSLIPTALTNTSLALSVFPGLCPGVVWRPTQFGGPGVKNCENRTAIGGGSACPIYGRYPCSGVVVNHGAEGAVNATQVRAYDEKNEAMALSVVLEKWRGECASCGRVQLHFMHTSVPAVLNVRCFSTFP